MNTSPLQPDEVEWGLSQKPHFSHADSGIWVAYGTQLWPKRYEGTSGTETLEKPPNRFL